MIPLAILSGVMSFVKNKKRLVIEYALIALLITVAGGTFALWLQKEKTEKELLNTKNTVVGLQSRITTIEELNQAQENRINDLKDLRKRDGEALSGVMKDLKSITDNNLVFKRFLNELENKNETVRTFLNQPVPPELAECLRSYTCETGTPKSGSGRKR